MKNLAILSFLILLSACATIPKNHFGIVVDKETEKEIIKYSTNRKIVVSSNEVIKAIPFNLSQPLEMDFLTKEGESMFIKCQYELRINADKIDKLVSTIESYKSDVNSRIETLMHAEMRAWTRNTLGGIAKSQMNRELVNERLRAKSFNAESDLFEVVEIKLIELK